MYVLRFQIGKGALGGALVLGQLQDHLTVGLSVDVLGVREHNIDRRLALEHHIGDDRLERGIAVEYDAAVALSGREGAALSILLVIVVMLALWQWLLAANQPAKLYLLLGTNALVQTGNEDSFINYYARMLDELRAALPNTTFYVQSILCATQETVEDDAPGLSPDHIGPINQQIKALCEERGLYYLDLNAEFSDENGYLLTDYAQPDGIHLTVSGYNKWVSYLCTHTPYSKNNPYQPGSTYYLSEEMQSQLADLP